MCFGLKKMESLVKGFSALEDVVVNVDLQYRIYRQNVIGLKQKMKNQKFCIEIYRVIQIRFG